MFLFILEWRLDNLQRSDVQQVNQFKYSTF